MAGRNFMHTAFATTLTMSLRQRRWRSGNICPRYGSGRHGDEQPVEMFLDLPYGNT